MDWTAEAIERLKALWAEGHSTAEIGRRMGISKNAVVGKAHRLNLPARPSPIRRDAAPRPVPVPRAPRPMPAARITPPPILRASPMVAPAPAPVAATPVVRAFPVASSRPRLGSRTCCWPIGEPGTSGFRFCGGDPMAGKPYCTEHAALAYVKPRDRREDAA
ncbi:GcrA cell cycle regulator [Roseomonas sp. PWR1]|uniref:GcrA cell cycle regulator n=1 Tax=Roseomonas nitratireducens TaxID=2820810 RepID=A0ABS4AME5_9PROT|nr:GcrA family cell cycle regulator [Neoroseomonas nitratireducens]MBP0462525.1 GcrA cell cycle regulator [Neoroseomonas nitratireducens]